MKTVIQYTKVKNLKLYLGLPGYNIEGDLHMEHYNGRFKVILFIVT